ncbi:hypothetical protein ACFU7Y_21335 [Kitasatospora sp. NPDC057542]|uniref:hypothetical protein n=1 Tax=Streptomycetaceae TaxID=2062 RepID=UPI001CC9D007|nr:hypothetical protein [Streptomyces sp. LS1784]
MRAAEVGRIVGRATALVVKGPTGAGRPAPARPAAPAPQIALIAFLPGPVIAWRSLHYQDKAAADHAVSGEQRARLHSRLVNSLEAGATVESFRTEDYEDERIDELSETVRESSRQNVRVCTTASMAGTLLIGGGAVRNGTLRFEVLSPLIGLPRIVMLRMNRLGGIVDQCRRTLAA